MTNQRIITAPVLIPNTPDCDYNNGEPPLTPKEIKHLQQTYKNYQIIDYQHKYTIQGPYYKRKIGTPIKSWITTKTHTYTDILNNTQTTPPGTWYLTTKITNPEIIKQIDQKKLTAYSLTTSEKTLADKFIKHKTHTKTDNIQEMQNFMSQKHRTNIHDISNPVAFTVSLTDFPCVSGAVFSKKCLMKSMKSFKNGDDIMTEENNTGRYSVEDIKSLFGFFTSFKSKHDEDKDKDHQPTNISEIIDTKIEENNKKMESSFKSIVEEAIEKIIEINNSEQNPIEKNDGGIEDSTNKSQQSEKENDKVEEGDKKENSKNKTSQSKGLDHVDDGVQTSTKSRPNNIVTLMKKLGRDGLGVSKFRPATYTKE